MEKTQSISVSISIIGRFDSVDDPRMERAGKRKFGNVIAGENGCVAIQTLNSPTEYRPATLSGSSFHS